MTPSLADGALREYRLRTRRWPRTALQKDADSMGIPLDRYWAMIVDDWDQAGTMRARWLPKAWRDGRTVYRVDYPDGWWVDIMSTHTLAALSHQLEDELAGLGITGGLDEPVSIAEQTTIEEDDGDLKIAQQLCKIQNR